MQQGRILGAAISFLLAAPLSAAGQNVGSATAQNIVVGQAAWTFTDDGMSYPDGAWYRFYVVPGRSYCAEIIAAERNSGANGPAHATIHLVGGGQNNPYTGAGEPLGGINSSGQGLTRACFIAIESQSDMTFATFRPGVPGEYTARVVETTLFSNWFFLGGDYGAYTLLRNTTTSQVAYRMTWRDAAGMVLGTFSGVLNGNGSAFKNARELPNVAAGVSGTVEIAHSGSPEAIVASTTVLSVTSGLSMDAPFIKRQPW